MFKITLPIDRAEPDLAAVASAFGISIQDVEDDIHIGTISRWFEVGDRDDDNEAHQVFASEKLGIRVDVDEHGTVKSVSAYERAVVQTGGKARLDALLDEALDESFPASDPIAISFGSPKPDDI